MVVQATKEKLLIWWQDIKIILRIIRFFIKNWRSLIITQVLNVAVTGLNMAFPYLYGKVLDSITESQSKNELNNFVLIYFLSTIGASLLKSLQELVEKTDNFHENIQLELFASLLKKDLEFFDEHKTGELTGTFSNTFSFQSFSPEQIMKYFTDISKTLFSFSYLLLLSWEMTAAASSSYWQRVSAKRWEEQDEIQDEANNIINEAFSNIRLVKAFSSESKEIQKLRKNFNRKKQVHKKHWFFSTFYFTLEDFLEKVSKIFVIWYGGHDVINGLLTPGDLSAFTMYVETISNSVWNLSYSMATIAQSLHECKQIFQIFDHKCKIDSKEGIAPEQLKGEIQFQNVSFSYPTKPEVSVLKNLSIHLQVGQSVAIVGSSGCGKSTVTNLIHRFYDVTEGELYIDGVDIRKYNLEWFHNRIGYVQQEPILFSGTIEDNICYGITDYTQEDIDRVAKLAQCYNFIHDVNKFPEGYNTLVGERGALLSGGEKQRIAIARALIKNPKILIFDEATSALDSENEHEVQKAIDDIIAKGTLTAIIIAHRLSTIKKCSRILVFQNGKIAEDGTHNQLLMKKGVYTTLIDQQLEDKEVE